MMNSPDSLLPMPDEIQDAINEYGSTARDTKYSEGWHGHRLVNHKFIAACDALDLAIRRALARAGQPGLAAQDERRAWDIPDSALPLPVKERISFPSALAALDRLEAVHHDREEYPVRNDCWICDDLALIRAVLEKEGTP